MLAASGHPPCPNFFDGSSPISTCAYGRLARLNRLGFKLSVASAATKLAISLAHPLIQPLRHPTTHRLDLVGATERGGRVVGLRRLFSNTLTAAYAHMHLH